METTFCFLELLPSSISGQGAKYLALPFQELQGGLWEHGLQALKLQVYIHVANCSTELNCKGHHILLL